MSESDDKFVQPERGPLGKAYEAIRVRISSDTDTTRDEGKFVQPERGLLGKAYEWIRVRIVDKYN